MTPGAVHVRDLRVAFGVASHDAPRSVKEAVLGGGRPRRAPTVALDAVDLDVAPGEAVGIVGHNGAGKSTLLQVVAGLLPPTSGQLEVVGRVGAMLEIGAGFHHELTGRESAVTAAVVAGLRRGEARDLLPEVAAYAELDDDVLDRPVRTYSTGMRARLAFAVAVHVAPDLLLVDEVLPVGDMAFQARCLATMRDFRDHGVTLLVVTHDTSVLPEVCDRGVWLRRGAVAMDGPLDDVLAAHRDAVVPTHALRPASSGTEGRRGDGAARVDQVGLVVSPGHLAVWADVTAPHDVRVQCLLVTRDGRTVVDTSCLAPASGQGRHVGVDVSLPHLAPGAYRVRVSLYSHDWELAHDVDPHGVPLDWPGTPRDGVLDPPVRWRVDGRELG